MTLAALFISASMQFNLPPGLLSSLCFVESRHDVTAIHVDDGGTDSIGVCQIKLKTSQWLGFDGNEEDLLEPKTNILYAAAYIRYNMDRYDGQVERAVVAYNKGNAKGLTRTTYSMKVMNEWRNNNEK